MKSKGKTQLVAAYIGALGLSAIRIMTGKKADNPSWIRLDLEATLPAADGPLLEFDALLFTKASHAELVFAQVLTVLGSERDATIQLPAVKLCDAVVNEAGILGAPWRSMPEVVANAEAAVAEIERHIEALNSSGGMREMNAGYRSYRLAMQSTGEAAMNYGTYLQGFKLKMIARIGGNVAAGVDKFAGLGSVVPGSVFCQGRDEMLGGTVPSSRVYVNRGWSNHSFRKSE